MATTLTYRPQYVAALLNGKTAPTFEKPAVEPTTADVAWKHQQTYTQFFAIVEDMVHRTNTVQDEEQFRYMAAFTEEIIKQLSGHLLTAANSYALGQKADTSDQLPVRR